MNDAHTYIKCATEGCPRGVRASKAEYCDECRAKGAEE